MSHWDTSFNSAVAALMAECSKRELSRVMAIEKLQRRLDAQVPFTEVERAVSKLVEEGYISDVRFAAAFTRDKLNFSGWGPKKIEQKLLEAGVSKEIAAAAIEQESELVERALKKLLASKRVEIEKRYQKKAEQYSEQLNRLQEELTKGIEEKHNEMPLRRKMYTLQTKIKTLDTQAKKALITFALQRGFTIEQINSALSALNENRDIC